MVRPALQAASRHRNDEAAGRRSGRWGYVMLDDFGRTRYALSFGVGDDVSWDRDMAELGATVLQFDHTVSAAPEANPNFRFHPRRIVAEPSADGETIHSILGYSPGRAPESDAVLKIDIEHDEWSVLEAVSDADLARFSQIICEFHWFGRARDAAWLERAERVLHKMSERFQVVHVHANNHVPYLLIAGVPFPAVLEVTYANRRRYAFEPNNERFPTVHDFPNHPQLPDYWLGRFDF